MPTTVNGIGTKYYGKSDATSRTGACQNCGAHTKLESYTTRLWFVIVFIPIIPLKRLRLLDYCPNCSRHWVANPEDYEKSRQLAVSTALQKYRDEPSLEAAMAGHAQLMQFQMYPEAQRFRGPALDQFPQSAELRAGFAAHLDQMGRSDEGAPLYESAYEINPKLIEVRSGLAAARANENRLDEAYELLDFLREPGAGTQYRLGQLELLARAYQKAGNHERTLELCEILQRELPAIIKHHSFRNLVAKSERALHRSNSMLPTKSFSLLGMFDSKNVSNAPWVRPTAFATVAAVVLLVGMLGFNEYRRTHRVLYVVNSFAQPLSVSIDGKPPATIKDRGSIEISEGKHVVAFTGPVNKQTELLLQSGFWSRWTYHPIWIFNLEKLALIHSEIVTYSAAPPPPQVTWLNETELSFVPHVDYAFEEPPQTLRLGKGDKLVTKVHVAATALPPTTIYLGLKAKRDPAMAQTYAEGQLTRNPNDASLMNIFCQSGSPQEEQQITDFLATGLWRKPISVVWHRAYQHQQSIVANLPKLVIEYDKHLVESPNDATVLYLRGRVSPNRPEQLKFFKLSLQQDQNAGWPAMGLAYDAANRGDWAEAKVWCTKAANTIRADPSFRGLWHIVRLANGEANQMETEYRQLLQTQDYTEILTAMFFLTDVLATQGKKEEALKVMHEWIANISGPASSPENLAAFDPMVNYMTGKADARPVAPNTLLSQLQERFQFQSLLALGDPDAAVKLENISQIADDWAEMLAISLAYSLADNQQEADAWLTRACVKLRESDDDGQRAATLLEKKGPPTNDELDEIVLRISDTPVLLATLIQRSPAARTDLLPRLQKLNVSRNPPHLLVQRVIGQP